MSPADERASRARPGGVRIHHANPSCRPPRRPPRPERVLPAASGVSSVTVCTAAGSLIAMLASLARNSRSSRALARHQRRPAVRTTRSMPFAVSGKRQPHRLLVEVDVERAFFGQVIPGQQAVDWPRFRPGPPWLAWRGVRPAGCHGGEYRRDGDHHSGGGRQRPFAFQDLHLLSFSSGGAGTPRAARCHRAVSLTLGRATSSLRRTGTAGPRGMPPGARPRDEPARGRYCGATRTSTARRSAATRSRHSDSCARVETEPVGSRSQSSASSGTAEWRQKCLADLANTSKMANLHARS